MCKNRKSKIVKDKTNDKKDENKTKRIPLPPFAGPHKKPNNQ